ncbi:MAG: DnaD domain protein [Lachnospiraceae bacterium]|nr:DnaD domain protein [Lachnospiraceae bacterium]
METITISTKNHETYSSVSNFFIDYYMTDANGEYVKVYLYLVRLLNSGRAVTVADIADHFDSTEKDICRAIKYWIKENVLQLEYTTDNVLTGITLLPLTPKSNTSDDNTILSMLGVKDDSTSKKKTKKEPVEETAATEEDEPLTVPEKISYKASYINKKLKEDEEFETIKYQIETIFGNKLTATSLQSITYIYDELHFSPELIEYLIDYCSTLGKKSCRYIEAVAIEWYKNGIKTKDEARELTKNYNTIYKSVLKQLGIQGRVATSIEIEYIDKWYNTYAFDKGIIIEACKRAVLASPQSANFNYVNGILENWHKFGVKKISDIDKLDEENAKKRKARQTGKTTNQFNQYHNSTSENVINEFENLFLQETNN